MVTVSLCMIVRDEENTLPHCLDSIKDLVDEIIIVDTGSLDNTKQIARGYTDKVFDFQWIDDFSAARNFSFSKATKDFIIWLDADDVLLEKDREGFKNLKEFLTLQFDTVVMKYILRRDQAGNETYSCYRERLVKRVNYYKWYDEIHEYLNFSGKLLQTDIAITHTKTEYNSSRNLKILKKALLKNKNITPRLAFYYARESQDVGNFDESIKYYTMFLDMGDNNEASYAEACIHLAAIYKNKNDEKKALQTLIRSFECGPMRAEILCLIGKHYIENKNYVSAISWYDLALNLEKPKVCWQFMMREYWDIIPYIELCHCYYYIGNLQKSLEYHILSKRLSPNHPAVIQNEQFFGSLLNI